MRIRSRRGPISRVIQAAAPKKPVVTPPEDPQKYDRDGNYDRDGGYDRDKYDRDKPGYDRDKYDRDGHYDRDGDYDRD